MNKLDNKFEPLASRLRPLGLVDFIGQGHLLGEGKILSQAIKSGHLHSMILWGPPGVGKTSLANLLANLISAEVRVLSAVSAGVKEIRAIAEEAEINKRYKNTQTVLFIDEIHRFSKSQQDALLPLVEQGLVTLIGATTENPSFELNKALLSRCRVHVLKALSEQDLLEILERALLDKNKGFGNLNIKIDLENKKKLIGLARQDARCLLNLLEIIMDLVTPDGAGFININMSELAPLLGESVLSFDKMGEVFYDSISALHKSIRGSDPDASLYWLAHLLSAGVDGLYIARRLVRVASEDVGNADPRALQLCLNAWDVLERLGPKEGELALGQAVIFLACAPKSNASYMAFNQAMEAMRNSKTSIEVPLHLRNSPTELMKSLGYGKAYRYPHDEPYAYAAGEQYFPEGVSYQFYCPTDRGLEKQIQEKLKFLKNLPL